MPSTMIYMPTEREVAMRRQTKKLENLKDIEKRESRTEARELRRQEKIVDRMVYNERWREQFPDVPLPSKYNPDHGRHEVFATLAERDHRRYLLDSLDYMPSTASGSDYYYPPGFHSHHHRHQPAYYPRQAYSLIDYPMSSGLYSDNHLLEASAPLRHHDHYQRRRVASFTPMTGPLLIDDGHHYGHHLDVPGSLHHHHGGGSLVHHHHADGLLHPEDIRSVHGSPMYEVIEPSSPRSAFSVSPSMSVSRYGYGGRRSPLLY
jgi:hypothetical protein